MLSATDVRLIKALEKRMEINVSIWTKIVEEIELETNIASKARYELQLDALKEKIGSDLNGILKFVERLGFNLQDHYGAARTIAENL